MLDTLDKAIIAAMQSDLPLITEPYAQMAAALAIPQDELLARLQGYRQSGKFANSVLFCATAKVGFSANALCAWVVPPERLDEIGSGWRLSPISRIAMRGCLL